MSPPEEIEEGKNLKQTNSFNFQNSSELRFSTDNTKMFEN